jgi:hypothetical protein
MNTKPTPCDSTKKVPGRGRVRRLPAAKQKRLNILMDKNNQGRLSKEDHKELRALVREVEELTLDNARRLAEQR